MFVCRACLFIWLVCLFVLAWLGLAWLGLAWLGLAGLGLAGLGLGCLACLACKNIAKLMVLFCFRSKTYLKHTF